MSDVRGCYFLSEALEDAKDEDFIEEVAEKCHCSGECTLEEGCLLYKELSDTEDEVAFAKRLRAEFVSRMLGE